MAGRLNIELKQTQKDIYINAQYRHLKAANKIYPVLDIKKQKGTDVTLAEQLQDATTADTATADVNVIIKEWKTKLGG